MKKSTNKIWRNKLEDYVTNLYIEQRKNCKEISEMIKNEKNIDISKEAVRKFIGQIPHANAL
jgi:hypothetical protein